MKNCKQDLWTGKYVQLIEFWIFHFFLSLTIQREYERILLNCRKSYWLLHLNHHATLSLTFFFAIVVVKKLFQSAKYIYEVHRIASLYFLYVFIYQNGYLFLMRLSCMMYISLDDMRSIQFYCKKNSKRKSIVRIDEKRHFIKLLKATGLRLESNYTLLNLFL